MTLTGTPTISGATVALTLASAVAHDDTVTVSYEKPTTDDSNRLEDADGNETADFHRRGGRPTTLRTPTPRRSSRRQWTGRRW